MRLCAVLFVMAAVTSNAIAMGMKNTNLPALLQTDQLNDVDRQLRGAKRIVKTSEEDEEERTFNLKTLDDIMNNKTKRTAAFDAWIDTLRLTDRQLDQALATVGDPKYSCILHAYQTYL
ncbi:hypothetical protein PF010_g28469 [Phytophthora fragariae]|uniref:RxLR effector protein n=1 Tax=Phytophthora fragariae TaxID=53985 RepID=A0A6G0JR10_9STRA|nr:hypothetical protein PF010_g28469 [Phytophthora fragariae]KAE9166398.1 hypothetical protein PF004_g29179 [Phytophthora fragariae]